MPTTFPKGTTIHGHYVVVDVLGKSEIEVLYLVRDVHQNQQLFVLKEMLHAGRRDGRHLADEMRFRRLHHPALPRIHAVFIDNIHGRAHLMMEYIEGRNLELLRKDQQNKRYPLSQVITMMTPIVDAVKYLHSQYPPILHQDIKPANILLPNAASSPQLVNLSLIQKYDADTTTSGFDNGTPGYGAPEQYSREADPRTDIYALGATLYTLLTGNVPADAFDRITLIERRKPDPLVGVRQIVPTIPPTIAQSIQRALSLNSAERFSTVGEFWHAFQTYARTQQLTSPLIPPMKSPSSQVRSSIHDPFEPLAAGLSEAIPTLHLDPTLPQVPEPIVGHPVEESPTLHLDPTLPQAPEPIVSHPVEASSPLIVKPPLLQTPQPQSGEEDGDEDTLELRVPIKRPGGFVPAEGLQNATEATSVLNPNPGALRGKRSLALLAAVIVLLAILGGGTGLWLTTRGHHTPTAIVPTVGTQPTTSESTPLPPTVSPNATATSSSTAPYPKVAGTYMGIIADITSNLKTEMSLTGVQQQQSTITGTFTGIHEVGLFRGTITTTKHMQFTLPGTSGQPVLSFDGFMLPDGTVGGTYCLENQAGACSSYGVWSVSPTS